MALSPSSPAPIPTDPAKISPHERLAELGAMLAQGVLRLHRRPAPAPGEHAESRQKPLDSGREASPHVPAG
jgi:hypothetical protein